MACDLRETQRRYLDAIGLFLRPNTVTNSRTVTSDFVRYLQSHHPGVSCFSELQRLHVEGWLHDVTCRPLRRSTKRNKIIKLRVFLEGLRAMGWKEAPGECLFRRGDLPPEDNCLPRPLSEDTDRALTEELQKRGCLIHKALLLLRATGLRSQELMDLKVESLRRLPGGESALHVPLGKLHSERVIPVSADTAEIFQNILQYRGACPPARDPETGKPAQFLLMRPSGRRFGRDMLRYHLGKIEKEAGLREHPAPHRLRHSFATEMLRAGTSLPVLMKLLGHRTIAMTLRYVQVTQADVCRAYAEAMEVVKARYEIPSAPARGRRQTSSSIRQAILSQLTAVGSAIESYRRDCATSSVKTKIQRLLERVRRLATDFEAKMS